MTQTLTLQKREDGETILSRQLLRTLAPNRCSKDGLNMECESKAVAFTCADGFPNENLTQPLTLVSLSGI